MPQDTKTTDSNQLLVFDCKNPGAGDPVYRQSHSGWGTFMNENAVWESNIRANNFNRSYSFTVPSTSTGSATAFYAVDDDAQISIDGVQVIVDAQSYTGVKSKQLSIAPGNHTISWTCQNGVGPSGGSGPGGLALLIYADNQGVPAGLGYSNEQLDQLKAKFAKGQRIRASHVEELLTFYSDFQSHNHNLTDITVKDTFGNTGGDQGASVTDATGDALGLEAAPAAPVANVTQISQTQHEALKNAFNSIRTHYHSWEDD